MNASRTIGNSPSRVAERVSRATQGNAAARRERVADEVGRSVSPIVPTPTNPPPSPAPPLENPSEYLERLRKMIVDKQNTLNNSSSNMQNSMQELDKNIDLMKNKIDSLETAKKTLEKEIADNEKQLSETTNQSSENIKSLEDKIEQLTKEKDSVTAERDTLLTKVNELEQRVKDLEKEWDDSKMDLLQRLKTFEEQELTPYLNNVETLITETNSRIDASNKKITNYLSGNTSFGEFESISHIFDNYNNENLFGNSFNNYFENNFGGPQMGPRTEEGSIKDVEEAIKKQEEFDKQYKNMTPEELNSSYNYKIYQELGLAWKNAAKAYIVLKDKKNALDAYDKAIEAYNEAASYYQTSADNATDGRTRISNLQQVKIFEEAVSEMTNEKNQMDIGHFRNKYGEEESEFGTEPINQDFTRFGNTLNGSDKTSSSSSSVSDGESGFGSLDDDSDEDEE